MQSKRNSLAGKHPSYDKLGMTEERRKKKIAYDKAYHQTTERKKYRAELNKANRSVGKKGDGKDVSHKKNGKLTLESAKTNRARNGQNSKSSLK